MRILKKDLWPYQVQINVRGFDKVDELDALDNWCKQSVGRRFLDWYGYSHGDNTRLYAFKDEGTLLVFKLKWGHYGTW